MCVADAATLHVLFFFLHFDSCSLSKAKRYIKVGHRIYCWISYSFCRFLMAVRLCTRWLGTVWLRLAMWKPQPQFYFILCFTKHSFFLFASLFVGKHKVSAAVSHSSIKPSFASIYLPAIRLFNKYGGGRRVFHIIFPNERGPPPNETSAHWKLSSSLIPWPKSSVRYEQLLFVGRPYRVAQTHIARM